MIRFNLKPTVAMPILAVALALTAEAAHATPFIPADDDIVLERIPTPLRVLSRDRRTEAATHDAPDPTLNSRTALARRYLKAERDLGDPRFIGYALAAIEPWSKLAKPPVSVLMLRATLRQRRHDFSGALADLGDVIAARPDHVQALLTRAFVLQATGRPLEALETCRRLPRATPALAAAACRARMESLVGHSARAERRLARALASDRRAPDALRAWALTVLGEIARLRGDTRAAISRLQEALAIDDGEAYRRDAYADLLIDAGRPADAIEFLRGKPATDGHLLRRAIAGKDDALAARLRTRLGAARQRGDRPHLREAARLALQFDSETGRALEFALENWRHQREPWDARLVLESALAAQTPGAAAPVIAWMARTGIEDTKLRALAARIGEEAK
jgi:Tfp pilus assembly protein PilF